MPKYVLLYESADDVRSKAPLHFPAHVARWKTFQDQGTLLMIGTFGNPREEGSMAIFTTREAAKAGEDETPIMSVSHGRRDADYHGQSNRPSLRGPDPGRGDRRHRPPEDRERRTRLRSIEL